MKKISRRDFLKVTGLMGAAAALTACGGSASSTAASTASSAAGSAAASAGDPLPGTDLSFSALKERKNKMFTISH